MAFKDGAGFAGVYAAFFDDCYHLVCEFQQIQFEHCLRQAIFVAHELARLGRFSPTSVWMDDPPSSVVPVLVSDVTLTTNE